MAEAEIPIHTISKSMSVGTQITSDRQWRLQSWLHVLPSAKPIVYQQVFATAGMNSLSYWLEVFFSAGIATLGLVQNSPAVIIGGMLISPLMGPIMATGLALAVGDLYLGIKAVLNLLVSITVSIAFSAFLVWLLPFHSATAEIVARTKPNLLDLGIALLSGLAGSVVVCRGGGEGRGGGESGGITALPGVAIAVALMPPLCTMGFGLGSGADTAIMSGAGLLFLTNLVAIVATAFLIFLLVGMNTLAVEEVMLASRAGEPLARRIYQGPVARFMAAGGHLRWRILMVVFLLAFIAVPLRRALLQVANETITRGAVQRDLEPLLGSGNVVSQQVTLSDKDIVIRLLSTKRVPESQIEQIRDDLMRRTGHFVQLTVDEVASKSELAAVMERLARPAPAPPVIAKPRSFAELQQELVARVQPAIEEIWPAADAPMQDFDVVAGPQGAVVEVRYQAAADLGPVPLDMIQKSIQTKLAMPGLTLKAERIPPPGAAKTTRKKAFRNKSVKGKPRS